VAQPATTFTGTATTGTVTGLTPGQPYTFTVAAKGLLGTNVLYRVNAGGPAVAATDGGPNWSDDSVDTALHNTPAVRLQQPARLPPSTRRSRPERRQPCSTPSDSTRVSRATAGR